MLRRAMLDLGNFRDDENRGQDEQAIESIRTGASADLRPRIRPTAIVAANNFEGSGRAAKASGL